MQIEIIIVFYRLLYFMVSKSVSKKKTDETIKWELLNQLQENDDAEQQGL